MTVLIVYNGNLLHLPDTSDLILLHYYYGTVFAKNYTGLMSSASSGHAAQELWSGFPIKNTV